MTRHRNTRTRRTPRLVCAGWWADGTHSARVHDEVRLLRDGDLPESHGICPECRDRFLALLPPLPSRRPRPSERWAW